MSSTIQKKTYIVVITRDTKDGGFVGRCDELHANSQGETLYEIKANMKEAVELAAKDLYDAGNFNIRFIQQ